MRNRLRPQHLTIIEATLIGVFFVQAMRFLIGMLYSRIGGAEIVVALDPSAIPAGTPGVVDPSAISQEISFVVYMMAIPLLTLLVGRIRWIFVIAAILTAAGRALMVADTSISSTAAASLAFGGGLLYIAMVIRYRAQVLPYMFILAIGIDQLLRAMGNTLDPTWFGDTPINLAISLPTNPPQLIGQIVIAYSTVQIVLSLLVVVLSIINVVWQSRTESAGISPDYGLLPFWGAIGLGGLLFLEFSLLALPNAVAGRANTDYTTFVPFLLAATLLPLIPWVRNQTRSFLALFDGGVRGWSWMLLIALLLVFGTRFQGTIAGVALVLAQFAVSMMWWWLVRPHAEQERILIGLWLPVAVLIFLLLVVGDYFTYEYAFVRNFAPPLAFLNNLIPPLLRGFRGLGLGVLLLSVFLSALPMIQTRRRIPWTSGTRLQSLVAFVLVIVASAGAAQAARPPVVTGVRGVETIRVGTFNIHAGFNEFFDYNLEGIAHAIQQSGANVVLLQEVEIGRMTSFGVDEALWLARRVGMDARFYPTNEGLQGLAVLSNVEIVFDDGNLLTSIGNQTGVQRVQIRPDAGVVTLYNTWLGLLLEAPGERTISEQEQDQQRQLNEIFGLIASQYPDRQYGRMIIGGTFNNIPDSPLIDQMWRNSFSDPFAGAPIERSATVQRIGLRTRLDYIWTRAPLLSLGTGIIESNVSDHRLVFVEVQITSQTQ
jgi:endonuclease/exonuclease/phosphatase family metal-dependent hydrolase